MRSVYAVIFLPHLCCVKEYVIALILNVHADDSGLVGRGKVSIERTILNV